MMNDTRKAKISKSMLSLYFKKNCFSKKDLERVLNESVTEEEFEEGLLILREVGRLISNKGRSR